MIQWSLGGKDNRSLVLGPQTTDEFRRGGKTHRAVLADAALIAGMKRESIDVMGSDGSWLATVKADGAKGE
jgi:hypothetical protein